MKKTLTCMFAWDGTAMLPTFDVELFARRVFVTGHVYRMTVQEDNPQKLRRTREQNDKMWAMLTEISQQVEHCGRHYSPDEWKVLLMHACGHEVKFLPALDQKTFVPYGGRSSQMTVAQMNELIEFMVYWGDEHGVQFATDGGRNVDHC